MIATEDLDAERFAAFEANRRAWWDKGAPFIAEALEFAGGSHTIEDVFCCYLKGSVQLWVGERCAAITEFHSHPRKRVLNVWLAGGDLGDMKSLQPGMDAFARGSGCSEIQFLGRPTIASRNGWARASGHSPAWVTMTRKL